MGLEGGLLGIAVDRDFAVNHYIYVFVTQPVPGDPLVGKPRIIRFTDVDGDNIIYYSEGGGILTLVPERG